MNALHEAVYEALRQAKLLHPGARLVCAVSGGADSTALLHALSHVQKEAGFSLKALHVQHGLRGESSAADEQFVLLLCEKLSVPLTVEQARLDGTMETPGMETMARKERTRIFQKHLQSADALLTAHHQDDQAETVLMHLMRGSGMNGLCGMRTVVPFGSGLLIRPFLTVSRKQILHALEGLSYRNDESNFHPVTPRNAIRLSLLPEMEALYPGAGMHMAQTAQILQTDEDFLASEADRLFERCFYGVAPLHMLNVQLLQSAHPSLVRRVMRKACALLSESDERSLSMPDTLKLASLVQASAGESLNLPNGIIAVRGPEHIHFTRTGPAESHEMAQIIRRDASAYRFDHCRFTQDAACTIPSSAQEAVLTPEILALHPVLRTPEPGDTIRPMGASGAKPLRRFFTDHKTDPFFRPLLPVLAASQTVLWVPGLCVSETLRLASVPEGSIRLTFSRPFDPHQSKE